MKKAMITGATGMLGRALADYLLARGVEVTAIIRKDSRRKQGLEERDKYHIIEADVRDLRSLIGVISGTYDAFFHFAWEGTSGPQRNDLYLQNRNIQYTLDAVELARACGCRVFAGAGSQAEYGRVEEGVKLSPELAVFPENGYGIGKLCAGQMSRIACEHYGIRHIWFRILSVYGPYDAKHTMIMSGIDKMITGKAAEFTKGEQMWDYLYSKDAAKAFYLAAVRGKDGAVYCVGSGQVQPLKKYIETMRDMIDPACNIEFGKIPYLPKQVMYLCADIRNLAADTGFMAEYTFEQGIRETIDWYRKEGRL